MIGAAKLIHFIVLSEPEGPERCVCMQAEIQLVQLYRDMSMHIVYMLLN